MTAVKQDLFTRGAASEDSATRLLTAEIKAAIADLEARLRAETQAELAALKQRERTLRAALNGHPPANGETAKVRAWARQQGIEVTERGRLSAELHAQYRAAQGGAA